MSSLGAQGGQVNSEEAGTTSDTSQVVAVDLTRQRADNTRRNREYRQRRRAAEAQWARYPAVLHEMASVPEVKKCIVGLPVIDAQHALADDELSMWSAGAPQLFPINETHARVPMPDELLDHLSRLVGQNPLVDAVPSGQAMHDGVTKLRIREVLDPFWQGKQLQHTLLNLRLPEGSRFGIAPPPSAALDISNPESLDVVAMNVGPSNSHVGWHVDLGYTVLTSLATGCEKVWFVAPPTDENMHVLHQARHGPAGTFSNILCALHRIVRIHQSSTHTVMLPAATIHATFTKEGGICYGNQFLVLAHVREVTLGIRYLLQEVAAEGLRADTVVCIENYCRFLRDVFLRGGDALVAQALAGFSELRIDDRTKARVQKQLASLCSDWIERLQQGQRPLWASTSQRHKQLLMSHAERGKTARKRSAPPDDDDGRPRQGREGGTAGGPGAWRA